MSSLSPRPSRRLLREHPAILNRSVDVFRRFPLKTLSAACATVLIVAPVGYAVAAGLIATATALAANPSEGPSLAEYIATICSAAFRSAPPQEAPFLAENVRAMTRMMAGMEIKPSGEVDQDFAAMMIPHHQGAIDMARAELRHGHNEQLRRIAQGIIVEQQQEIAAMRLALGQPLPPSVAASDQPSDLAAKAHPTSTPTMNVRRER